MGIDLVSGVGATRLAHPSMTGVYNSYPSLSVAASTGTNKAATKIPSASKASAGGSWKVMDEVSNTEVVKQINNRPLAKIFIPSH